MKEILKIIFPIVNSNNHLLFEGKRYRAGYRSRNIGIDVTWFQKIHRNWQVFLCEFVSIPMKPLYFTFHKNTTVIFLVVVMLQININNDTCFKLY